MTRRPLKNQTLYTAQVLTDETATANFVSKEVFEQFDKCGNRFELFKKKDVQKAVEWLKEEARLHFTDVWQTNWIFGKIDEAFADVQEEN